MPRIITARFMRHTLAQRSARTPAGGRPLAACKHTPAPQGRGESFERQERYYERAVAAAATFFAALAAFAAVDALRRRLVFGGVAGASPISSALIMLVTNSFGP